MNIEWKALAEQHRDEFIEELKKILSIDSVEDMSTAAEGRPFGIGVAESLDFMLQRGEQDGFATKNLEGFAGIIEFGDAEDMVGVLGHVDVVPAGEGWTTPPFQPDIRNGRIYARGAIDDKGPTLAAYFGMRIVRDLGLPLSKRVRFIVGTDEESGWLCMRHYEKVEAFPEIGFSPDADFPIIHAEKGQINPVLSLPEGAADDDSAPYVLWSFSAGERVNMVPDQATATVLVADAAEAQAGFHAFLKKHQVQGKLTVIDGGFTVDLEGKAAHGMEPQFGVNAGTLLATFLNGLTFSGKGQKFLALLVDVLHEDHFGERLGVACEDDVTGPLTVNPGVVKFEEGQAIVSLNVRYPATIEAEERVNVLRGCVSELGWEVASVRTSKSHFVPKDHPAIQTLLQVYHEQTGLEPTLLTSGGATYARSLKHGVAYGAVFPGEEMTAHQRNEYANLDSLVKAMAIYAQAIYELAK
ncbi:MAG: dipeptidase PepV [Tumebacillaceae bacterium]